MRNTPKSLLKGFKFDIYERVSLVDTSKSIDCIESTELTPKIKLLFDKENVQLVGELSLRIKYWDGMPWNDAEFKHSIPVEITIPTNRVSDAWLLDVEIESFNIEQLGSRTINVTGVLKVYEKEKNNVSKNELVKLPREVAEAIDSSKHMGSVAILGHLVKFGDHEEMKTTKELYLIHSYYKKNPYLIASALVNGYEIEETPEDKARDLYEYFGQRDNKNYVNYSGKDVQYKIREILNILGKKVKGVNDNE